MGRDLGDARRRRSLLLALSGIQSKRRARLPEFISIASREGRREAMNATPFDKSSAAGSHPLQPSDLLSIPPDGCSYVQRLNSSHSPLSDRFSTSTFPSNPSYRPRTHSTSEISPSSLAVSMSQATQLTDITFPVGQLQLPDICSAVSSLLAAPDSASEL
ncbi:hypothetical protein BDK51DRAFT_48473 [Blyttiomyces helicus]|uniref:Uncharacterized protein n=1 Tax=Blyttiomyces helicus TaxID=388810 RepID=A0A4P9WAW5_9FUNG|nr:hypothetical protein BDK51DRAFT_48473 [Blyttiomyces helicus]|eukprot:RKO89362.1 hypothetical protein BDK51DRAFT_48473 [Blyttiomyces helicus]